VQYGLHLSGEVMRNALCTAFLLVLFIGTTAHADEPISVCDLIKPGPFLDRLITVKARMLFSIHGSFFLLTRGPHQDKKYGDDIPVLSPNTLGTPEG
jgi:hypothetical protein